MSPLVSIIIPCHNAAGWVAQAIQSALDQTWQPVEVIVIDDGSTDTSLEVIKSFGNRITCESGPARGMNHARNRGLELARGEYIQFLDASCYLAPEKIGRQMPVLRGSEFEVVYEDWRRVEERPDGSVRYVAGLSGGRADILEALLSNWVPQDPALLYKRQMFERNIRWNERFAFAQDWEMHIRLAMAGVSYGYVPGCYSIIRCPREAMDSAAGSRPMEDNIVDILKEAETHLRAVGNLTGRYRRAMARAYLALACGANEYFDRDRDRFEALLREAQRLSASAVYPYSPIYLAAAKMFGVRNAERMRSWKRRHLRGSRRPSLDPLHASGAAR
jgi:glycosyltransferase involved in cell wall biosynthesis